MDKNINRDGTRKLHVLERCGSCKYWKSFSSEDKKDTKFGLCCYSTPSCSLGDDEAGNQRAWWPKTHREQRGCGNFSVAVRYKRYINSRLVDEELVADSIGKILDRYIPEEVEMDWESLEEDLGNYFKGKIPDYVAVGGKREE